MLMRKINIYCYIIFSTLLLNSKLFAQSTVDTISTTVNIGEVVVNGTNMPDNEQIDQEKIKMYEKNSLSDALGLLPSIIQVPGAKTDMVYVRGFDLRQVPVYYDGIPIYIPYDGYIDLGMLTSSDISNITISSGTGSLQYGPNALGGAINIVTARPTQGFNGLVKAGTFDNGGLNLLASLSYAAKKYYLKASYTLIDKNNYRLSNDYVPTSSIEDGGELDNSYKKTGQLSVKVGFTPTNKSEYAISYIKHDGEKGIQPYLGTNGSSRYWKFPIYDKESLYFLTNNKLGNSLNLKTRWFYDTFDNTLESYDDTTYTTQNKKYAFTSIYDDYTLGGIATLSYLQEHNNIVFDAQFKFDNHKEHDVGEPIQEMEDQSASLSLIDNYYMGKFTLHGGISMNYEEGLKAQYLDENDELAEYATNSNTVLNGEFNILYKISNAHEIRAGLAHKTRFPTMKNRYSASLGKSNPNPDLKAEDAMNYTLDYGGKFLDEKAHINISAFYSHLTNAILKVYGVDTDDASIYQLQNTGKAEHIGMEASVDYQIIKPLLFTMDYSYVKKNNLSSPDEKFTDVPENSFRTAFSYKFKNQSYLNVNIESYSDRYSTSDGIKVDGYSLLNCKGKGFIYKNKLSIEAGINNILDKNYEVSEGYPMPGRNAFASAVFTF